MNWKLLYERGMVIDFIQEKIIRQELERTGSITPEKELYWSLINKTRTNEDGKTIRYYYNYTSDPASFVNPFKGGTELISEEKIKNKETMTIESCDILIIEE